MVLLLNSLQCAQGKKLSLFDLIYPMKLVRKVTARCYTCTVLINIHYERKESLYPWSFCLRKKIFSEDSIFSFLPSLMTAWTVLECHSLWLLKREAARESRYIQWKKRVRVEASRDSSPRSFRLTDSIWCALGTVARVEVDAWSLHLRQMTNLRDQLTMKTHNARTRKERVTAVRIRREGLQSSKIVSGAFPELERKTDQVRSKEPFGPATNQLYY